MQIWPSVLLLPLVQLELRHSSSVLRLFVRSFLYSSMFFVSSLRLFILPRCWRPDRPPAFFSNQIAHLALDRLLRCCISPTRTFFKYEKNRVSKTQFCFLELESYKLEIYVAKLAHDSSRTQGWRPQFSSSILSF